MPHTHSFPLIREKDKDLHEELRKQVVGGPSIIFHRYHEKGITKFRGESGKAVQSPVGYDANSLYLWAISQEMPTEHSVRRRKENNFQPELIDKYGRLCRKWLECVGARRIRVDEWNAENNTVYQFHGCFFHGQECHKTEGCGDVNLDSGKSFQELRERTAEITQYLREEVGVKVIEMYECDWEEMKEADDQIVDFVNTHLPQSSSLFSTSSSVTKFSIL
ncbi:hypothetical protein ElyMa_005848000 [Elysia marginata]|uniref:DNA-directed DNA polymerase n=1 Tax=Elysia marginata TaxID=1093978 RepID=A0AAV4G146_9GAST|nr:hypothetical protein ElyMa_005848000 [Elysia marginata]